ncbi:MAG: isocitrate lyase/phosphoenolpyruvate mutase family protein [Acidimicrobiales bacterium]
MLTGSCGPTVDLATLDQMTSALSAPVNVMLWPGLPPIAELTRAGVRRVSQGAGAFLVAAGQLEAAARAYLLGDEPDDFGGDAQPAYHLLGDLAHR